MHGTKDANSWLVSGATRDTQSAKRDPRGGEPQRIEGVFLHPYAPVATGYGRLSEMLRTEWLGENVGVDQVFLSSLIAGASSAWHAHEHSTDRLFVAAGTLRVVLYDNRSGSPSRGMGETFTLGGDAPGLLIVPPKVWHGIRNIGADTAHVLNAVDVAYCYESPDHWRVPPDSPAIPSALVSALRD